MTRMKLGSLGLTRKAACIICGSALALGMATVMPAIANADDDTPQQAISFKEIGIPESNLKITDITDESSDYEGTASLNVAFDMALTFRSTPTSLIAVEPDASGTPKMAKKQGIYRNDQCDISGLQYNRQYLIFAVKTADLESAVGDDTVFSYDKIKDIAWTNQVLVTTKKAPVRTVSSVSVTPGYGAGTVSISTSGTSIITSYALYNDGKHLSNVDEDGTWSHSASIKLPYATGNHEIKVIPFYVSQDFSGDDVIHSGNAVTTKAASKAISAGSLKVTKISANRASINIAKGSGATGVTLYVKSGKKWKKLKTTTSSRYVYNKKGAGKMKFRARSYIKTDGKTYQAKSYTKQASPGKNEYGKVYKPAPAAYSKYKVHFKPMKLFYSGGKLKMTGYFVNGHIVTLKKGQFRVYAMADNKKIGEAVINSGKMKSQSTKKVTVTLKKAKKNVDIRGSYVYLGATLLIDRI